MFNFIKNLFHKPRIDYEINMPIIKSPGNRNYIKEYEIPISFIEQDLAAFNCGFLKDKKAFILITIMKGFDPYSNQYLPYRNEKLN